jgi:hypothetical protein
MLVPNLIVINYPKPTSRENALTVLYRDLSRYSRPKRSIHAEGHHSLDDIPHHQLQIHIAGNLKLVGTE